MKPEGLSNSVARDPVRAFEKDFPGAPVVRLEENFRSTPKVLRPADELIRAARQGKGFPRGS